MEVLLPRALPCPALPHRALPACPPCLPAKAVFNIPADDILPKLPRHQSFKCSQITSDTVTYQVLREI